MFAGRRFDKETELYYYRARYYNPIIGRFSSRDPISWGPDDERIVFIKDIFEDIHKEIIFYEGTNNPNLFHRYNYVDNNPTNWRDPTGLWVETALDVASLLDSLNQLREKPGSLANWLWAANDVAGLLLPLYSGAYLKGVKYGAKTLKATDKATDYLEGLKILLYEKLLRRG